MLAPPWDTVKRNLQARWDRVPCQGGDRQDAQNSAPLRCPCDSDVTSFQCQRSLAAEFSGNGLTANAPSDRSKHSELSDKASCHAIDEFVDWYCSEPRLAFNRIVVLRYRSYLESLQLAPGTVNLRLGAARRLAYEAVDCGLLSSDLAAGIRRIKGVKKTGCSPWKLVDCRAGSLSLASAR
jgi:hypothetical protein